MDPARVEVRRAGTEKRGVVEIPRQQILEFVEGGPIAIGRAAQELPECVDTDRDAGLLSGLGIDVTAVLGQFDGGARHG